MPASRSAAPAARNARSPSGSSRSWPPSHREARRFLSERLPGSAGDQLEAILNRAGCNYGELSRLALFKRARAGDGDEGKLQGDPALQGMLQALAALSPEADPAVPLPLLEAVLGRPLSKLSQAEQALIEPQKGQLEFVKPALRTLLPERVPASLHEQALDYYLRAPDSRSRRFRTLYHAKEARDFGCLLPPLEEDPSRLALLPGLWTEADGLPEAARVRLAYVVVRYRAVLGAYTHPEAQDALAVLAASADQQASAWARVKVAEAQAVLSALPELSGEAAAEAMLVRAALVRWRGDYTEAEAQVRAVLSLPIPPLLENRARLWQGLVAKDAGRFDEALAHLGRVSHNTLLMARARYQEGDLRGRLGDPERGPPVSKRRSSR